MIFKIVIDQMTYFFLTLLSPVILSLLALFILTLFTPVILSLSKDRDIFQASLRRFPRHFDRACPEFIEGLSVTEEIRQTQCGIRKQLEVRDDLQTCL